MRLTVQPRVLRLAAPLRTAWGRLDERPLLEVTLTAEDGVGGTGEAAPLEGYDGVPLAAVRAALDAYTEVIAAADETVGPEELRARCRAERDLPQALAAIDVALWDQAGRRVDRSVASLLSIRAARSVPVNAVIGALDPLEAAWAAAEAVGAGYDTVKVKVGVGDDVARLRAVRAAVGHGVALRVDANGAWSVEEAVQAIDGLAAMGIEFVEEPVHGVADLAEVRARVDVPLAMDETGAEPGAVAAGAVDAVCLKISRCGGISGVLADAAAARAAGSTVYLASTYDGPVGIAAGVHVAAALHAGGMLPAHGLSTLDAFADGVAGPRAVRGAIRVPGGPGLGI